MNSGNGDWAYLQIAVPASPGLRGLEIETYVCYARKYLLRGGPVDLALQELRLSDMVTAGTNTGNGQIFQRAVLSFVIIFFGSQHGQVSIITRGYAMHGGALKQLNHALSDPKCYTRDDVILSVVTLALLECFVPTGPKYYLKHMVGLEKLLELRGPAAHYSPKSFELHKGVRRMILFAALSTRKPSILARDEWKTVFRNDCSDEEMEEQFLFDALADCTVLVANCDEVLANWNLNSENVADQRDKVKRATLDLLKRLQAWRRRWDNDGRNSHVETPATSIELQLIQETWGNTAPPFRTVFKFANDSAATMLTFYNTALIYALQVLASLPLGNSGIQLNKVSTILLPEGPEPSQSFRSNEKDEYTTAERSAALEVCRCISYNLVRKSRLDSGSLTVVHLAVKTAWMILRRNESLEGRWMTNLLKTKSRGVVAKGLWVD